MPREIYGDIQCASGNVCSLSNKPEFAALVAQLRYQRLNVEEDVVESSGEFDSFSAGRVYTTAGSKNYRSYSSGPPPLNFAGIGLTSSQPSSASSSPNIRQPRRNTRWKSTQRNLEAIHATSIDSTPLKSIDINIPECHSDINTPDCNPDIDISGCHPDINTPDCHPNALQTVPLDSTPLKFSNTGSPRDLDFSPVQLRDTDSSRDQQQSPTPRNDNTHATHQHEQTASPADDIPLSYDWPVEGAQLLYTAAPAPSEDKQADSVDSQDSWRISSTSILTAPPPVTAAMEAAESFMNLAAAGLTSLSSSSKDFFDRSTVNLKDAAVRSSASWQQAFSKVSQALQTARAAVETPRGSAQTPRAAIPPLRTIIQTPRSTVQTPRSTVQTIQTPRSTIQTPRSTIQTPRSTIQTPRSAMQAPSTAVQTPRTGQGVEQTEEQIERPAAQILKRAATLTASVREGFIDAVQQAKDILMNM